MTKRPTNAELCAAFRALLTSGATNAFEKAFEQHGELLYPQDILDKTKPWRGELWRAFRELEKRLCPQPEDFK